MTTDITNPTFIDEDLSIPLFFIRESFGVIELIDPMEIKSSSGANEVEVWQFLSSVSFIGNNGRVCFRTVGLSCFLPYSQTNSIIKK